MAECREIGVMLGAVSDGELEPDEMEEVAHHLLRCASCTVVLSDYSTIGRELRAIAIVPSLEGFTESVLNLIEKLFIVAIFAVALHWSAAGPNSVKVARSWPEAAASTNSPSSSVMGSISRVDVRVDSVFVADANEEADPRLAPPGRNLDSSSSTTLGSVSHWNRQTKLGKMIVFRLPGGKILHIRPRAIDREMITMEVAVFDGKRTTITIDLNLENGDTFALGGGHYKEGTLLIRISPSTSAIASPDPRLL